MAWTTPACAPSTRALIYCSVTGFGQDGPYAERAGYDLMIQAMTGMMSITGRADGEPGGGPLRVGVALTDLFTGVYASSHPGRTERARQRHHRHRRGGQHIDMALLDVGMAILANQASGFLATGVAPTRQGNKPPQPGALPGLPRRTAPCCWPLATTASSPVLRGGGQTRMGAGCTLCQQHAARAAPHGPDPRHEAVTRTRPTADWIALLEDKAVPCGPINTIAQAFDDARCRPVAWPCRCRAGRRRGGRRRGGRSPAWPARCACQPTRPCCATPHRRWASTPMKC